MYGFYNILIPLIYFEAKLKLEVENKRREDIELHSGKSVHPFFNADFIQKGILCYYIYL